MQRNETGGYIMRWLWGGYTSENESEEDIWGGYPNYFLKRYFYQLTKEWKGYKLTIILSEK